MWEAMRAVLGNDRIKHSHWIVVVPQKLRIYWSLYIIGTT